ncbi:hypothetical protein [Paraburkholderia megapolitana]|uniref:hypothetical protein n=1 Tax=Paraburkholderia megapolitana TaxID=420953 RepID=UPI0038BB162B
MNPPITAGIVPWRSAATSLDHWLDRLRVPLEAWSGARRLAVALLVAVGVFVPGARSWSAVDLGGIAASRVALDDAQRRLVSARHVLAQLPALRARVAAKALHGQPVVWTSADDVRAFSQLAARSELVLVSLEPGAASGEGIDAMRSVKLAARGNFAQIMRFVHGLTGLPVLVVPADLTVKRHDDALEIAATLQVFSKLIPVGAGRVTPQDGCSTRAMRQSTRMSRSTILFRHSGLAVSTCRMRCGCGSSVCCATARMDLHWWKQRKARRPSNRGNRSASNA